MSLPYPHHTQQRHTVFLTPEHVDDISEERTGEEQVFEDMGIFFFVLERLNFTSGNHIKNWVVLNLMASPGDSDGKESACSKGDQGFSLWLGGSPGEGNGNPLQYSCLENPMDRGAWQATMNGVTKSWT